MFFWQLPGNKCGYIGFFNSKVVITDEIFEAKLKQPDSKIKLVSILAHVSLSRIISWSRSFLFVR